MPREVAHGLPHDLACRAEVFDRDLIDEILNHVGLDLAVGRGAALHRVLVCLELRVELLYPLHTSVRT